MGIDFSHCWPGMTYHTFHLFRCRIAASCGIDLDAMQGYQKGNQPWRGDIRVEPLLCFLHHPDTRGSFSPRLCRMIAMRLRAVAESWGGDPYAVADRDRALRIAEGMEQAALRGERFRFR